VLLGRRPDRGRLLRVEGGASAARADDRNEGADGAKRTPARPTSHESHLAWRAPHGDAVPTAVRAGPGRRPGLRQFECPDVHRSVQTAPGAHSARPTSAECVGPADTDLAPHGLEAWIDAADDAPPGPDRPVSPARPRATSVKAAASELRTP